MVKKYGIKFLAVILFICFHILILQNLSTPNLKSEPILITDLLRYGLNLPIRLVISLSAINLLLVWIICRRLLGEMIADFASLVYSISPWIFYLDVSGSIYVVITFLLLIFILGLILFLEKKTNIGFFLMIISATPLFYLNIMMWVLAPLILVGVLQIPELKKIKFPYLSILALLLIPLFIFSFKNRTGFLNVVKNNFVLDQQESVLASINTFRGQTNETSYKKLSKIVENRYIGLSEVFLFSFLKQFTLSTYFTSQVKLMGYSFSPPILIGFIFPFFVGLSLIPKIGIPVRSKVLILLGLLLPSTLSSNTPDLGRLLVISPIFFSVIAYGLCLCLKSKKRIFSVLFFICFILVIFQSLVIWSDIMIKEPIRLHRYEYGN